jgi:hypothetical protein
MGDDKAQAWVNKLSWYRRVPGKTSNATYQEFTETENENMRKIFRRLKDLPNSNNPQEITDDQ